MAKGKNLQAVWDSLSAEDAASIRQRAAELKADYMPLHELRKTLGISQATLADSMNMSQPNLSRLEKQMDMHLSTLRAYVEGLDGKLTLTVEIDGRAPIHLTGIGDLVEP